MITNEAQILDPQTRAKILADITGPEELARKNEAYNRYLSFKDQTRRLVVEQLAKQFDDVTIQEMSYALANISVVKKVISKLSQVYANGVVRKVRLQDKEVEEATKRLQKLEEILDFNTVMKTSNRFLKLQKNLMVGVLPKQDLTGNYCLKVEPYQPYNYSVIPNPKDKTCPWIVILSAYKPEAKAYTTGNTATAGRTSGLLGPSVPPMSDGKDQINADPDDGKEKDEFIWWSPNYHFTTDAKGEITKAPVNPNASTFQEQYANPIKRLPFVNFAIDQDGEFWAMGGDDLIDGAVLINSMISQTNHISVIQGYGQFWMKGKNLPRNVKVGPSKVILLEWGDKEDPEPSIGYASSNTNLEALAKLVEMYTALLLSTNNLSTSSVAAQLAGNQNLASGIALMIDKAESREDVQDQQQIFKDKETDIWNLIAQWSQIYAANLGEEFKQTVLPTERFVVSLAFNPAQAIQSEGEKLDNLQKRQALGINTKEELLMMDNPGMTDAQAKEKLAKIGETMMEISSDLVIGKPQEAQPVDGAPAAADPVVVDGQPKPKSGLQAQKKIEANQITDPTLSLNGAQVTALLDLMNRVAQGLLPRESGVELITAAFSLDRAMADRIMGTIGKGFKVELGSRPIEPEVIQ